MERLKSITIIFLLAMGLLSSVVSAKTTSVLLQEGLYAEEIQGDLDAAIKIYEQVITGAEEAQKEAAQATYRIGMCYLKKGENAKAVIQFRNLVSSFPEQKSIVDKAHKQLAKLSPPTRLFEPQALVEQIKSGKVPSFEVHLPDNTGLDLDSGEIAMLKDKWPDRFDVAWDNDEGGVLMKKTSSEVRFLDLPSGEKQMWDEAIYMARSDIGELRKSNTRRIWASQGKFAAVLTSEGNLAVIQIGEFDANKGTIYGWVEKIPAELRVFGPVMERVINDDGEEKDWLIDFDTSRLFSHTTDIPSEEKFLRWCAENRIDAMGETSGPGLYGFDMAAIPIANERWKTISPKELAEDLSIAKVGTPAFMSAAGKLPVAYIFKTREGGMGIVQIMEMQDNKKPRHFSIRYKMLLDQAKTAAGGWRKVFLPDADTRGTDVVLDFASGELLPAGEGDRQLVGTFAELGKGDLAYDRVLICLRGAKAGLIMPDHAVYDLGEHLVRLKVLEQVEDVTAYQLDIGHIPGRYLVTTGEDKDYVVNILSADARGVELIYKKATGYKLVERRFEFGAEFERIMQEDGRPDSWIDFDTAQMYHPPKDVHDGPEESMFAWIRQCGIDAAAENGVPGFMTIDLTAVRLAEADWNHLTPSQLIKAVGRRDAHIKPVKQGRFDIVNLISIPNSTFGFKTREGGLGILQVVEFMEDPWRIKIRYKMLQEQVENPAIANALSVAKAFLAAAVSGRDSDAIKLVKPGSAVVSQVKDFRQILDPEKLKIVSILVDESIAVVTTTEISAAVITKETRVEDKGPLLIRLIKQRGMWMVEDVDLETPASLKAELDSFLRKHPNATKLQEDQFRYKMLQKEQAKSLIDLSTPEATIKSFVKAVYVGNLEAAKACVSKDGHDYDEFMEMLATESNHPFQAMIKAMDASIPVEITSKDITEDRCKIKWYFTLGRVYYIGDGETKWQKGKHPEFSSYLELVGDKWLIRDL